MTVILFGATGMIGQGVLRECLLDEEVERVVAVGRRRTGKRHEKLHEVLHEDFSDFSAIEGHLAGYDACFFCLGASSAGMNEKDYRRVTYDVTLAAAKTLVKLNPGMTFIYVSGTGTDSTAPPSASWKTRTSRRQFGSRRDRDRGTVTDHETLRGWVPTIDSSTRHGGCSLLPNGGISCRIPRIPTRTSPFRR